MQNLNTIKTAEDLKNLPISDDWHKIDKSDKYHIKRDTKNCFMLSDSEFYCGSIIKNKKKYIVAATLHNISYELDFETLEKAFAFLIEKAKTIYIKEK